MKKTLVLLFLCIAITLLCACGRFGSPTSTTRPLPNYEPAPTSEVPDQTEEPNDEAEAETDSEPTEDVRDNPETIRQEIANMLRDAEALIRDGLYDDAKMVLRDLRSRDLTEPEKEKVDELYTRLNTISD